MKSVIDIIYKTTYRLIAAALFLVVLTSCSDEEVDPNVNPNPNPNPAPSQTVQVSTLAGSTKGFADGTGDAAKFNQPIKVALDALGNVFVADRFNHKIRKITPDGTATTLAGSTQGFADGSGADARFNGPVGIAVDASGIVYVADQNNHKIRKITTDGEVSTLAGNKIGFADGLGLDARFNAPAALGIDILGNIYIGDSGNHSIRKITPGGVVTTLAGTGTLGFSDGPGATAQFNRPVGIAIDASFNVYVADRENDKVRKITPSGEVSTLAGGAAGFSDGIGDAAKFWSPLGVALDASDNLYIADFNNNKIRMITPNGSVSTYAGTTQGYADGPGETAKFGPPSGVAVDASGIVYVADQLNNKIRKITKE